ncbi:MAG: tetratricopeptide (TPR) repeat protein [Sediminicola sp.]|jgi:tetratricopeptide (TPR) repeat protein
MIRKTNFHFLPFLPFRKYTFLLFFAVSTISTVHSQEITGENKNNIATILQERPSTIKALETALKPALQDTLVLTYFIDSSKKRKYHLGEAFALNQLGAIYQKKASFKRAITLHTAALSASELAVNLEIKVFSLNMLSLAHLRQNSIQSALDNAQSALFLAKEIENPSDEIKKNYNTSLNLIGNIYKTLEQWEHSIPKFQEALELEKQLGNNMGLALNYQDIGESLEAQGKLSEALINYNNALFYNKNIGSSSINIKSNLGIAHIYVHQEKFNEGLRILESLLEPAKKLGNMELLSELYINIGWTLIHLMQNDMAKENLLKGFEIAQNYNFNNELEEAYIFLSDLSAKEGNHEASLNYYKRARSIERKTLNDRNIRYVADLIYRSETEKKNSQIEVLGKENEIVKLKLRKNQTTLLISGFALALLGGILYILFYQRQLKNEKQLLTLESTMLRSQMNPHFLFNSLNSIKLYIINNEKKNAVHYLNKFSKLIRKILEASSVREISLADELETVQLYMNIENIRFNDEINFEVVVEKNIDTHTIKIPSLILQPFLENALWHGLSGKEGVKHIELRVKKENIYFTNITITDNGIGRESSERIKKNRIIKRKSVGIKITKERLANFSKGYQNSFTFDILDLYDDENRSRGTMISLNIPVI